MIVRDGDDFYYSSSTMQYSPGAPILHSRDLVNWEYIGHSVPALEFDSEKYDLVGGQAYVKGIWASMLAHRESDGTWFWGGCIERNKTYFWSAPDVNGPWERISVLDTCYYDASLLVDDDGSLWVAYGSTNIVVAQITDDATAEISNQVVFEGGEYIEGSRFYKRGGNYYIFVTRPADAEYVLMSTTGPLGPYTKKVLVDQVAPPITGGYPHQGGMVCTAADDCYYMAFIDAYPQGRSPVLAPLTWGDDGFPSVTVSGVFSWSD
jgi:beta-xylosidase